MDICAKYELLIEATKNLSELNDVEIAIEAASENNIINKYQYCNLINKTDKKFQILTFSEFELTGSTTVH